MIVDFKWLTIAFAKSDGQQDHQWIPYSNQQGGYRRWFHQTADKIDSAQQHKNQAGKHFIEAIDIPVLRVRSMVFLMVVFIYPLFYKHVCVTNLFLVYSYLHTCQEDRMLRGNNGYNQNP